MVLLLSVSGWYNTCIITKSRVERDRSKNLHDKDELKSFTDVTASTGNNLSFPLSFVSIRIIITRMHNCSFNEAE